MAQTYKFGNGTWATKKGSTLAYNDQGENFKPLPFTTTRNSIGTRVNKEGLIEVVGNDVPRIDYTDSAKGVLLLENSSTNLVTYSEDFSQSYWNSGGVTVSSIDAISPDGTQNADLITEDTSNGFHLVYAGASQVSGRTDTMSVFIKNVNAKYIQITSNNTTTLASKVIFDIELGVIDSELFGTGTIENYGNGWYKLTVSGASGSTGSTGVGFRFLDNLKNEQYTGDGLSSIYLWGFQYEANSSYATSYIPTNDSTVQRAAETCNDSGNSEVFNDSEGVLFADISAFVGAGGGTRRIEVSNAVAASQYVRLQIANGDGSLYGIVNNGTQQFLFNATSFNATLSNKISLKYKQNDFSLFLNGFEVGSSNVGNTFANGILTQANFSSTLSEFYGKTKELGYYDTALTDLELETLTSYRSLNELVTELNLNTL